MSWRYNRILATHKVDRVSKIPAAHLRRTSLRVIYHSIIHMDLIT